MPWVIDVPPALQDRARDFLAARGGANVAAPRDAATVVLLRDGAPGAGPEVYLLRRAGSMAFAAGMHVFPGGSVDPRDREAVVPRDADWACRLRCPPELARVLVCAAVRETFEESGVLLAGPGPDEVLADTTGADLERDRLALLERSLSMAGLLARHGLVLRSDLMRAWAHWVTPEFEAKRFDTRFFVAAVPPGQVARDVSGEADDTVWLPVRVAVDRHDAGSLAMLAPTIVTLREIAGHDTVAGVLAAPRTVRRVMPRLVVENGRLLLAVDL